MREPDWRPACIERFTEPTGVTIEQWAIRLLLVESRAASPACTACDIVTDVARAVSFYTNHLGFKLEHQQIPAFASVSLGSCMLLLSGPGASGSRPMPGGESQKPGGFNRVVLRVTDLPAQVHALKDRALRAFQINEKNR